MRVVKWRPLFLFVMGAAIPFSVTNRRSQGVALLSQIWHTVRRSIILFCLDMIARGNLLLFDGSKFGSCYSVLHGLAVGYLIARTARDLLGHRIELPTGGVEPLRAVISRLQARMAISKLFKPWLFAKLENMNHTSKPITVARTALLLGFLFILGQALAADQQGKAVSTSAFAGRWDLTIKDANNKLLPSWIELILDNGQWKANYVGRWGNVRPLPKVVITGRQIQFVSPKEEEDSKEDLFFEGMLAGKTLTGSAKGPNGASWTWTGKRAPALPQPATIVWEKPLELFNGRDLAGWTFDNPAKAASWRVENGSLVNQSAGSNIATKRKFQDFKLHVEVNCPTNANSGIYLRGRYEVQVEDDSLPEPPSHHMGAVYGYLTPTPEQPRRPGEWQTFEITLLGRFVTVVQNGQTIINNKEIPGITGGAFDSHEELPGPIYFQGDHGGIAFRNIVLTPAKH